MYSGDKAKDGQQFSKLEKKENSAEHDDLWRTINKKEMGNISRLGIMRTTIKHAVNK